MFNRKSYKERKRKHLRKEVKENGDRSPVGSRVKI